MIVPRTLGEIVSHLFGYAMHATPVVVALTRCEP
jgi:hypothetical protein